jgi:colicin import membrane protein
MIDHGKKGIRRFDNTGDPLLCVGDDCYAGMGAEAPARGMKRLLAFGAGNTLGRRAWSCSNSLTCVLRSVPLGGLSAEIQPIDLRIMYHDRRETAEVRADGSCSITGGNRLVCANPVVRSTWKAWIVPEAIARKAGPKALTDALAAGLPPV